uniref:methionine adenosyltransferase n=1 Tax=Bubo bubo TaxID=30461 RepID=A0A8C0FIC7_BUBBB
METCEWPVLVPERMNVMSVFYLLDKICDQISDAVLDAHLSFDPDAKVCVAKTGMILLYYQQICIHAVCYCSVFLGLGGFKVLYVKDSAEMERGHGNECLISPFFNSVSCFSMQGLIFGYATDETEECMPLSVLLVHKTTASRKTLKWNGTWLWLRPGRKTQVCNVDSNGTVEPIQVYTLVISVHHALNTPLQQIQKELMEKVVKEIIPEKYLDEGTIYHLLPSEKFVEGGPKSDPGLTGRKIIGTYGGWGSHGGGAFSGKDPSKVDCSAAYAAQWITKSLVKADLCKRVLTQVRSSSCNLSVSLWNIVWKNFDLRFGAIIRFAKPIYQNPACYGHFGREEYTWEIPKKLLY